MTLPIRIAVIGAGIAGIACAAALAGDGRAVTVFDKGRGIGGRLASRRTEGYAFDHGAQYATARGPEFRTALSAMTEAGIAEPWLGAGTADVAYVGVPGMSAIVRFLANGLTVRTQVEIKRISGGPGCWMLTDATGTADGPFEIVIVATPVAQAQGLLEFDPRFLEWSAPARIAPTIAALVAFAAPIPIAADSLSPDDPMLRWAARNSSKPGRSATPECWVLHATRDYSRRRLEDRPTDVAPALVEQFARLVGADLPEVTFVAGHRWRYAFVETPAPDPFYFDRSLGLAACGDWCLGPRVEFAYSSGRRLARAMTT